MKFSEFGKHGGSAVCVERDAVTQSLHSGVGEGIPLIYIPRVRIGSRHEFRINVQALRCFSRSY